MDLKSRILLIFVGLLTIVSVSATFYKTVVLQDFDVTGVWIEFPSEDSAYVWFIYDNQEYELELETSDYEELIEAVSDEVGIEIDDLDKDFVDYFQYAYDNAELTVEKADVTEEEQVTEEETGSYLNEQTEAEADLYQDELVEDNLIETEEDEALPVKETEVIDDEEIVQYE